MLEIPLVVIILFLFQYRSRLGSEQQGDFVWPDIEKTGGSAQFKNGSLSFDTNGVKRAYVVKTGENIGTWMLHVIIKN